MIYSHYECLFRQIETEEADKLLYFLQQNGDSNKHAEQVGRVSYPEPASSGEESGAEPDIWEE